MTKLLALPLLLIAGVGCSDHVLDPPAEEVSFAAASAACRAVQSEEALEFGPGGFAGTVTGDLVGTIQVEFLHDPVLHGVASLNDGIDFIDVTGGAFPELIGKTLEHRHKNLAVFAPGLDGLAPIIGHGRLVGEVAGHLTFHGVLDLNDFSVASTYRGNICMR
ncbi:MAG: hypothetical protein E4G90_09440 [Gemmatimonadales bacterium]|nr:MAG: hypothetical protein E4G90_09440 [Gemmatimonadales bacterium]